MRSARTAPIPDWLRAAGAAAILLLMGAGGYSLYLHAGALLQRGATLPSSLILGLALAGGAASFFSPCSIAITPAFLAYLTAGRSPGNNDLASSRPLVWAAGLVALGILVFYSAAGVIIGAVGNVVYNYLIYFIPIVGAVFVLLGALILLERGHLLAFMERWNPMNRRFARQEASPNTSGMPGKYTLVSFGFAYGAASNSCSLPIFLGVLLLPLVAGNYMLAVLSVLTYGLAIATLVVVMMLLGQSVFAALRRTGPWLMRATALLFMATGGFLFVYFGQNFETYRVQSPAAPQTTMAPAPQYQLAQGADPTGYPYQPRTLTIPAGRDIEIAITDHVGGCLLETVFEGLGAGGHAASLTVPVGETRVVRLHAPRRGHYTFHCGGNMYSGTVVAQ